MTGVQTCALPISILGLADGSHTVRILVTGTKRSVATGTWITVDGFTPR